MSDINEQPDEALETPSETIARLERSVAAARDSERKEWDQTYEMKRDLSTTRQQLLAAQVDNKRLLDALETYGRHGTIDSVCAFSKHSDLACSCGLLKALATPPDLSALSLHDAEQQCIGAKYVLGKVLEFMPAGYFATALIRELIAELDQAPQGEKP